MAQITRSTKVNGGTTLAANTLARAADVETDMLTLFTAHNNHDSGSSKWTVVSAEGATSVPLVVNNSSGTQDIAQFNDNGTTVLAIKDGGQLQASNGTAAAPTFGFSSSGNTDNGMYLVGSDNLGFSVGGTKRLDISSTAITSALPLAMGSSKITGLAAATANGDAIRYEQNIYKTAPAFSTTTTQTSTTSSTYQSTNSTASITPSSSSARIKITISSTVIVDRIATTMRVSLFRGATDLDPGGGGNGIYTVKTPADVAMRVPLHLTFIDSPATTSSTTYTVKILSSDGANAVIWAPTNAGPGIMVLEEIV